jgi:hypothetical protein
MAKEERQEVYEVIVEPKKIEGEPESEFKFRKFMAHEDAFIKTRGRSKAHVRKIIRRAMIVNPKYYRVVKIRKLRGQERLRMKSMIVEE